MGGNQKKENTWHCKNDSNEVVRLHICLAYLICKTLSFLQTEIVKRLSAIVGQVLPFLSQEHQQQVATAVERAKTVTMAELNSVIGVRMNTQHFANVFERFINASWVKEIQYNFQIPPLEWHQHVLLKPLWYTCTCRIILKGINPKIKSSYYYWRDLLGKPFVYIRGYSF